MEIARLSNGTEEVMPLVAAVIAGEGKVDGSAGALISAIDTLSSTLGLNPADLATALGCISAARCWGEEHRGGK